MTLTKADIVELIHDKMGISKRESSDVLETLFESMKKTLESGEKIKVSGFGNFETRDKKERRGRNPRTGDSLQISARRVVSFKPSPLLREMVNTDTADSRHDTDE